MRVMIIGTIGVTMLIIDILLQEFTQGSHSKFTSWMAGWYLALGSFRGNELNLLFLLLCCLPSITILIVQLVRRFSHAERV